MSLNGKVYAKTGVPKPSDQFNIQKPLNTGILEMRMVFFQLVV
jgi:hypothetical protein